MNRQAKVAVYERIATKMTEAHLNNTELARKVNKLGYRLTARSMSIYAKGDAMPGLETIVGICLVLNCSADYLLFGKSGNNNGEVTVHSALMQLDAVLSELKLTTSPLPIGLAKALAALKSLDDKTRDSLLQIIENASQWHDPSINGRGVKLVQHRGAKGHHKVG